MIEIDGALGGGQLLRTAVGLSALRHEPVRIINIRKGKKECKPGLRPQHLIGVKVVKDFCDADVKGLEEGSLEVEFIPKELNISDRSIDIGTAGNIGLLLQTITPLLVFANRPVILEIIGGTETRWAPAIQYIQHVTYPMLEKLGAKLELKIIKHGYYPKGRGRVIVKSKPVKKLRPFVCLERGKIKSIHIDSVCGKLPSHVAERQGKAALRTIQYYYPKTKVSMVYKAVDSVSPGSSVTCYAVCENSILGGDCLGERGLRAEIVGQRAAEELVQSLKSNACLDKYMADQILLFLALAKGKSRVTVEKITNHVLTNIHVIEKILPVEFEVKQNEDKTGEISVRGVGFG